MATDIADLPPEILREYPAELLRYVVDEAEQDADDVAAYLRAAGLAPPPGETRGFPAGALLELMAVVRLRRWETAGLRVHLGEGLPSSYEAMRRVVTGLFEPAKANRPAPTDMALARAVFEVSVTRFAWTARAELGPDVVIDPGTKTPWSRPSPCSSGRTGTTGCRT